jgi:hypothetical protein
MVQGHKAYRGLTTSFRREERVKDLPEAPDVAEMIVLGKYS